eukprot:m.435908 g.435908  ORF g.435908 m.435908 type:complete len:299 (+) comp17910_c0_seq1:618-1514(+)
MPFSTMPIYRSSSAVTALFFGLAVAPVFASPLSNSVLENSRVRRNPPPPPPTLAPTVSNWSKIELPYATDDLVTDVWGNSGWTKAGVEDFYDNVYGEIIDNANTAQSNLNVAMQNNDVDDIVAETYKLSFYLNKARNLEIFLLSFAKPMSDDCNGCPPKESTEMPQACQDATAPKCPLDSSENMTLAVNHYFGNWSSYLDAWEDKAANPDHPDDDFIHLVVSYTTAEKEPTEVEMKLVTINTADNLAARHGEVSSVYAKPMSSPTGLSPSQPEGGLANSANMGSLEPPASARFNTPGM